MIVLQSISVIPLVVRHMWAAFIRIATSFVSRVFFNASLPVGIVGLVSAIHQGNVSVAGINILAKNQQEQAKGIVYAVMVEMYAILAFAISFLMMNSIGA